MDVLVHRMRHFNYQPTEIVCMRASPPPPFRRNALAEGRKNTNNKDDQGHSANYQTSAQKTVYFLLASASSHKHTRHYFIHIYNKKDNSHENNNPLWYGWWKSF